MSETQEGLDPVWIPYDEFVNGAENSVTGTVLALGELYSPQLDNRRSLLVYLPPSYGHEERRYPVVYMHDGQNLFDEATSFSGEWGVDETMNALSSEGIEAIVVAIPNLDEARMDEYSPFYDPKHGGGAAEQYVAFIVDTVKPLIDSSFATLPDPSTTFLIGSSMGGLVSLYAGFTRPDVFGHIAAISPSIWFAKGAILTFMQQSKEGPQKVYIDVGTAEPDMRPRWYRLPFIRRFRRSYPRLAVELLRRKGYRLGENLLYYEEDGGDHSEAAWNRRLPDVLRYLLADTRGALS